MIGVRLRMANPKNTVIIMTDQHSPKMLGCAGHPHVLTPNLDLLAANGVYFSSAYTPSPLCVPARAALDNLFLSFFNRISGEEPKNVSFLFNLIKKLKHVLYFSSILLIIS